MALTAREIDGDAPVVTIPMDGDKAPETAPPEATAGEPLVIKMPIDVRSLSLSILAVLAAIWLLRYAQEVVIPVVLALLISFALDPLVNWCTRRRLPRWLGVVIVLAGTVTAIGVTVNSLRDEAFAVVDTLPDAARKLRQELRLTRQTGGTGALEKVQEAAKEIEKTAAEVNAPGTAPAGVTRVQIEEPTFRASEYLSWGAASVMRFVTQASMIVFLVYFLLLAGDKYKRKLVKIVGPTLTEKKITVQILDEISARIERFLVVQLFTSVLVAVATGLALWWIGVNQAGIWGVVAGIFNSIPYFGPVIVTAGLAVVGFVQFGTIPMALYIAGVTLVITTLEGWLLTPALMGKAGEMSPVAIFVGLLFWTWMWGVAGIILAVPLMMVIKAVCDHVEDLQWVGELLGE